MYADGAMAARHAWFLLVVIATAMALAAWVLLYRAAVAWRREGFADDTPTAKAVADAVVDAAEDEKDKEKQKKDGEDDDEEAGEKPAAAKPGKKKASSSSPPVLTTKERELFENIRAKKFSDEYIDKLVSTGVLNEELISKFMAKLDAFEDAGPSVEPFADAYGPHAAY